MSIPPFLGLNYMDCQSIFARFPKLKEIHCDLFTKIDILNLIKERKLSNMLNVRIYCNGFSVNEQDEVEELFGNDDRFELTTQRIVSNYHRLPRVVQMCVDLDYNELVRQFGNRIPSDLHNKILGTQKLRIIGNVDDQDCLLRFIGKLRPRKLEIKFTSLNQTSFFYENLHLYLNRGVDLIIEENPGVITNLDFILKLGDWYTFSINQQIPYELIERLINQLRISKKVQIILEFLLNDQPIKIVLNNFYHLAVNQCSISISGQEYSYTIYEILNAVRQVFGI